MGHDQDHQDWRTKREGVLESSLEKLPFIEKESFNPLGRYPRKSVVKPPGLVAKQPFTALYLLAAAPFLLLVVPLFGALRWTFLRLFDSRAPRWTLLDFVCVYLVRQTLVVWFLATNGGIRGFFHRNLTPRQRIWRKVWLASGAMPDEIAPFPTAKLVEPMKSWARETRCQDVNVKGTVPIWWKGKRAEVLEQTKAKQNEKLLVYLTGGGYMMSSCHPGTPLGGLMAAVMDTFDKLALNDTDQHLPRSAVTVEYRKSGSSPTPSAFVDCLALWQYVVEELQFEPKNIVLLGDSAGGHLVNTMVRYLQDANMARPGSTVVISPWTDQAGTLIEHPDSSYQRNVPYDVLSDLFYHTCRDTFAMHFRDPDLTLLDVYFSPCAVLGKVRRNGERVKDEQEIFADWPPTFIASFRSDVLLDQSTEMARRLTLAKRAEGIRDADLGRYVQFAMREGPHDPFVAPPFAFRRSREQILRQIAHWLIERSDAN